MSKRNLINFIHLIVWQGISLCSNFALAGNPDSLVERQINPKATDSLIFLWNNDKHYVYLNNSVTALNKLFVFLPGSFGVPESDKAINQKAANIGFHSIGLRYPNTWVMAGQCGDSPDVNCHYNLRREVLYGVNTYSGINVSYTDCIENRLIKLILYMDSNYPDEEWGQFVDANNELVWSKIAMGGHSQGGGYGAIAALDYKLFRVLNFASNDYSSFYNKPANYYSFPKQTPSTKYYGIVHAEDGPEEFKEMMAALGSDTMVIANADIPPPFYNSQVFITNNIPPTGNTWFHFHNSVAVDASIPRDSAGNYQFDQLWQYMLTDSSLSVGIKQENANTHSELEIHIYPNPNDGRFSIDFGNSGKGDMELLSTTGQLIIRKEGNDKSLDNWDLKGIAGGLYFLNFDTNLGEFTKKVLIQ